MARTRNVAKTAPPKAKKPFVVAHWRTIVLVLGLAAVAALAVYFTARSLDQKRPARADEIKQLLVVTTQRAALSSAAAASMLDQLKNTPGTDKVNPKVVAIIPAEVDAFFAEAMSGGLGDALVPVFAQRFTSGEIEELLAFYRSPLGKKLAEQMPVIAEQSAPLAQQWTYDHWGDLSQRVEAALKREGIALPQRPAPLSPAPVNP